MACVRQRYWQLGGLIVAAAIFLATCMPLTPLQQTDPAALSPNVNVTVTSDDPTAVSLEALNGQIVLDIQSSTGIGNAGLAGLTSDVETVALRLHVAGLEHFNFAYGSTEIEASIPSSGEPTLIQSIVGQGGQRESIGADSPYWLTIEPLSSTGEPAESIPLENGYFNITPPDDFGNNQPECFSFSWIDFYR